MKLSVCFAVAALVAGGVQSGAAAQDRTVKADESITATGCLQRAQRDGSAGGTVVGTSAPPERADDEANSSEMVDKFLLASAVPAEDATARTDTPSPAGTSGRVQATSFGLEGHEAELEKHNGARVEVTGVIIPPATSGRGTGGAATASGVKRIRVASFKVLAEKCTTP